MPETTVLIPTYNCAKYLIECIESILNQTYSDYEILLIDDGSTDNSREIIETFSDPRIRYFRNEKNLGIVKTLNLGIDLASGEFIARMDADDIMVGDRLANQVKFLKENQSYGMVGAWYEVIDEEGRFIELLKTHLDSQFLRLALLFRNQFAHSAVTMRAEILRKLKYDGKFQYCEDHELWIRFSQRCQIANLPEKHLSYRWYQDNSCNANQTQLRISVLKLLSRELDYYGITHSASELMVHAAVCFGIGPKMFLVPSKKKALYDWYEKLFSAPAITSQYEKKWLMYFKQEILTKYCCITSYDS